MDGICEETSGFLFSHPCDRPAVGNCFECGRAVCQAHTASQYDGVLCTSCAKQHYREEKRRYFDKHDPYYYPTHHYPGYYYDEHDFNESDEARLMAGKELTEDEAGAFEDDMGAS